MSAEEKKRTLRFAMALFDVLGLRLEPPPMKLRLALDADMCCVCGALDAGIEATLDDGLTAHHVCQSCVLAPPRSLDMATRARVCAWAVARAVAS